MINLLVEPLQYGFMQRALLTAVLVGVISAVVGSFLLVKRWSLLGDAISHAVLPGVALAYLWGFPYFIGAVVTALLTAVGISFVEQHSRIKADAAMGIMFISAFAAGLAIMSRAAGQVDIFHVLFGNVLGVSDTDLWLAAGTGLFVLLVVGLLYKELLLWAFDPGTAQVMGLPVRGLHYLLMLLLSVTTVASLQAVGIVLVVAMLITPAATAFLLVKRFGPMLGLSALLGVTASVIGLYLSYYINLASGATMVLVSTAFFLAAFLFSPREGLVWQSVRRHQRARRVAVEDYLKVLHGLSGGGQRPVTAAQVATAVGASPALAWRRLRFLIRRGEAQHFTGNEGQAADVGRADSAGSAEGPFVSLTPAGIKRARMIIRSHRLWERYLTEKGGMPWHAVHAEAHALEHETPPGAIDRMEEVLGFPRRDPHGAPIPTREGGLPPERAVPLTAAAQAVPLSVVRVEDDDPAVLQALAALGIIPGSLVSWQGNGSGSPVSVTVEGVEHHLPPLLAAEIFVEPQLGGNREEG